jgi:hypothetical protein
MLAPVIPWKETMMSEQLPLFDLPRPTWLGRLLGRVGPEKRREVISILAEMVRVSLAPEPVARAEEVGDES